MSDPTTNPPATAPTTGPAPASGSGSATPSTVPAPASATEADTSETTEEPAAEVPLKDRWGRPAEGQPDTAEWNRQQAAKDKAAKEQEGRDKRR